MLLEDDVHAIEYIWAQVGLDVVRQQLGAPKLLGHFHSASNRFFTTIIFRLGRMKRQRRMVSSCYRGCRTHHYDCCRLLVLNQEFHHSAFWPQEVTDNGKNFCVTGGQAKGLDGAPC